jgi:hypothetical protein
LRNYRHRCFSTPQQPAPVATAQTDELATQTNNELLNTGKPVQNDDTTNRLAALKRENDRLRQNSSELLKLRDEVTRLRAESRANSEAQPADNEQQLNSETNSLQYLVRILSDKDEKITRSMRYDAAHNLRALGPEALTALPEFEALLRTDTEARRYAGAAALAFVSDQSPTAFQQLTNALVDPDPQVRDAASYGVSLLFNEAYEGVDVLSTLPTLLSNLEDPSRTVRADTVQTLRQFIDRQQLLGKDAQSDVLVPP